eukprot:SAG11_NODE_7082_length_1197_cov_1.102914_1_plen_102_part_00
MEGGLKKLPLCYIANSMWSACTDGAHGPTIISNRIGSFSPRLSYIVSLRVERPWLAGKIVVLHARQVTASGTGSMDSTDPYQCMYCTLYSVVNKQNKMDQY